MAHETNGFNSAEAIRLLGIYTAGRFDIWMLAGSSKASCRAHVMSVLVNRKVSQKQAGINALRESLYAAGNISGSCEAHRQENFLAWAKTIEHPYIPTEPESELEWLRRTGAH
jgi:hypothetical protein